MNKALRIFVSIMVILTVIMGYGIALAVGDLTLFDRKVVWGGSLLVALIIGVVSWRWWRLATQSENMWLNYFVNLFGVTGVMAGAIYAVNFWGRPDGADAVELRLPVERLVSETRYRTKRVGRRNVGQEPYRVYRAYYLLPDGERKHVSLQVGEFAKARKTDSVVVKIERGLLGAKVISSQHLKRSAVKKRSPRGSFRGRRSTSRDRVGSVD